MSLSRSGFQKRRDGFKKPDRPANKFGGSSGFGRKGSKFLPFAPQLAASVVLGRTTGSFRLHPRAYHPKAGEKFTARCNGKDLEGVYLCRERRKISYSVMCSHHWESIGLGSLGAYEKLMHEIYHGDIPRSDQPGIFFRFERIE